MVYIFACAIEFAGCGVRAKVERTWQWPKVMEKSQVYSIFFRNQLSFYKAI